MEIRLCREETVEKIMKKQVQNAFNTWVKAFKKAGESDVYIDDENEQYEYGTIHMYNEWLNHAMDEIPTSPSDLLAASERVIKITAEVAVAVIASLQINGRENEVLKFIEQQRYRRFDEIYPKYIFIFDLGDEIHGCAILRGDDLSLIDLADLYGFPFNRLRINGFYTIYIAHADHTPLNLNFLKEKINYDLLYDQDPEDELWINFENNDDETVLCITVTDAA